MSSACVHFAHLICWPSFFVRFVSFRLQEMQNCPNVRFVRQLELMRMQCEHTESTCTNHTSHSRPAVHCSTSTKMHLTQTFTFANKTCPNTHTHTHSEADKHLSLVVFFFDCAKVNFRQSKCEFALTVRQQRALCKIRKFRCSFSLSHSLVLSFDVFAARCNCSAICCRRSFENCERMNERTKKKRNNFQGFSLTAIHFVIDDLRDTRMQRNKTKKKNKKVIVNCIRT